MRWALVAAAMAALALAGCGGGSGHGGDRLKVSAASSLKVALPEYDSKPSYSFAGSDELAAQIRAGARPDVFAAANTALPDDLYKRGLVERPVVFASNRLVIAAPIDKDVRSIADLAKPGVTIAAGAPSVPAGAYTRELIERLPADQGDAILANIRSNEPDVAGVIGKVSQGAVDAGFVYVTDVAAVEGGLTVIELPQALQPDVNYAAAVVKGTGNAAAARRYVKGLVGSKGTGALTEAGFRAARNPK
jgi:molybdate transport system substrate-binding protein